MIINLIAALAMGSMFAFIFWILTNMSQPVLFQAVIFVLGGFAESMRRWWVAVLMIRYHFHSRAQRKSRSPSMSARTSPTWP